MNVRVLKSFHAVNQSELKDTNNNKYKYKYVYTYK